MAALLAVPAQASVSRPTADLTPDATSTFFVVLKNRANLSGAAGTRTHGDQTRYVYETKKATAEQSQAGLRRLLAERKAPFTPYWIVNAMKVTGTKQVMAELARRPEVEQILPDRSYPLVKPVPKNEKNPPGTRATGWNIDRIRAPEVWRTYGTRGEGIIVGTIDTGAQFDHPAIARQYRGAAANGVLDHAYSWYDPSRVCGNPSTVPCDNIGHGTHVLGTIVGDDGQGNQIGVAPGATWVAAKGCETNDCSLSALLSSGQWMVAPTDFNGENPRPELAPNIVNNSWGSNVSGDVFYQEIVNTWTAAGIFSVFAAGNGGPSCNTVTSPADYDNSYAVGAFDGGDAIAGFSARGPGGFGGNPKPNIAAPGVDIRSSIPGGGYQSWGGTSMATPHVAGAVALMWSAAAALRGQVPDTRAALDATATDAADDQCGGTPENNNVWGQGRLDAYAAVTASPRGPVGALTGTVRADGQPLSGADITVEGPLRRTRTTGEDGTYQFTNLPVGRYTVTASLFGYLAEQATVTIAEGATVDQGFTLQVAPRYTVSGHVRDDAGAPVAAATVRLLDTPLEPASTDADGAYRFADVPAGHYDLVAEREGCLLPQRLHAAVDGDAGVDFTLTRKSDSYGHVCIPDTPAWADTDTVMPLVGDDASTPIALPFPVNLYEQSYASAFVHTNGLLSFTTSAPIPANQRIPNAQEPSAAIYALWDDLAVTDGATVRTGLTGDAPDRRFTIEWRNVWFLAAGTGARVSFQIVLYENGRIVLQYRDIDDVPVERGASATIGIENEDGTAALQYASDTPVLDDTSAILLRVPGTGFARGVVTDVNDGQPVSGATVTVHQDGVPDRTVTTDASGAYQVRANVGEARLRAEREHYITLLATVRIEREETVVPHDFVLGTGRVTAAPDGFDLVVPPGQQRERRLTLSNTGRVQASWGIRESGGGGARLGAPRAATDRTASFDPNARTSQGFKPGSGRTGAVAPAAVGDVLQSWPATGLQWGWGLGSESGNVWISDAPGRRNASYTTQGVPRNEAWPTPWAGEWTADMAYVPSRRLVCQVEVGGRNGIYCWNPRSGEVAERITGAFPWSTISQRGLAYRADDDTFYIGGWNEGVIYHINGLGHPDPGAVIGRCSPADRGISGLGWNDAFGRLWVATNTDVDRIYSIDPDTCETLSTLAPPDRTPYTGAGLELDQAGNLWILSQGAPAMAYLIDSGLPNFTDVPWVSVTPSSGTLVPNETTQLTVRVDTTGLAPGRYGATIFVLSESGREPTLAVPVRLVVPAYRVGVNSGGDRHTDASGDPWAPDRAFTAGGYGYLANRSRAVQTRTPIAGTTEQPLHRNLRQGAYEYRFDKVPNGVYEIELKFAELQHRRPDTRLFDVIVEGELRIPALDVAGEVGSFTALDRTLTVAVTDGQLNVRLIDRAGETIINAIRVTHRPDKTG